MFMLDGSINVNARRDVERPEETASGLSRDDFTGCSGARKRPA
jgi:hypothetical protein